MRQNNIKKMYKSLKIKYGVIFINWLKENNKTSKTISIKDMEDFKKIAEKNISKLVNDMNKTNTTTITTTNINNCDILNRQDKRKEKVALNKCLKKLGYKNESIKRMTLEEQGDIINNINILANNNNSTIVEIDIIKELKVFKDKVYEYISVYYTKNDIKEDFFNIFDYMINISKYIQLNLKYDKKSKLYIGIPLKYQQQIKDTIKDLIKHIKIWFEAYIWGNYINKPSEQINIEYIGFIKDTLVKENKYFNISAKSDLFYRLIIYNIVKIENINIYALSSDATNDRIEDDIDNIQIPTDNKNSDPLNIILVWQTFRDTMKFTIYDYATKTSRDGGYSTYYNTYEELDLTRYQIHNEEFYSDIKPKKDMKELKEYINKNVDNSNCFLYSFKLWLKDINNDELNEIYKMNEYELNKLFLIKTNLKNLKYVCELFKINININYLRVGKNKADIRQIGLKYKDNYICNLGCICDHYFIDEVTEYKKTVIRNYHRYINHMHAVESFEEINNKNINAYSGKYFVNDKKVSANVYMTSFNLIKYLYQNDYLKVKPLYIQSLENKDITDEDINNIALTEFILKQGQHNKISKNNNNKDIDNTIMKDKKDKKDIIACDFETLQNKDKQHIPDLMGYHHRGKNDIIRCNKHFKLYTLFDNLIRDLPDTTQYLLYFHNLKYDYAFFKQFRYTNILKRNGVVYQVEFRYNDKIFKIRDSLKLCNQTLNDFTKNFAGGAVNKTYFPYNLYNVISNDDRNLFGIKYDKLTSEQLEYINNIGDNANITEFNNFIDEMKNNNDSLFSLRLKYLKNDVDILYKSIMGYYEGIKGVTDIINEQLKYNNNENISIDEIKNKLTISGISGVVMDKFFNNKDIMNFKGLLLDKFKPHIKGGITWYKNKSINYNEEYLKCNPNFKGYFYIGNKKIYYSDINSSYPAALKELLKIGKIRSGNFNLVKPTTINITDDNKDKLLNYYLNEVTGFYKIDIKNVIPNNNNLGLYMYKNKDNVNSYTNDYKGIYNCDCLELYRLIKYGGLISFDIIEGFDNHNKQHPDLKSLINTIEDLYIKRKSGNSKLDSTIKLLLNSLYGYSIIARVSKSTKSFSDKDFKAWINNNKFNVELYTEYFDTINDIKWFEVILNDYDTSFNNFSFMGCLILSMSKHNLYDMNNYLNNNGYDINYTDTDSIRYCSVSPPTYNHKPNTLGTWDTDYKNGNYGICDIILGKKAYCVLYDTINNIKIGIYKFDINKHNEIFYNSLKYYKMSFKGLNMIGREISGYLLDNYNKYYDITRGIYRFDWLYIDIYNDGLTINITKYNNMKLKYDNSGVSSLKDFIQVFKF